MGDDLDIVGLATYAMDVMMNVDALPGEDGFAVVISNTYVPGGSGTNVVVQAARLGARCGFLALVGDDSIGRDILKSLEEEGVDTAAIRQKPGGISLHTDVVVDSLGKKFILLNMGDSFLDYREEQVDFAYLKQAKVYYTDLLPAQPAVSALKAAKEYGLKTAFNMQVGLPMMEGMGATRGFILESLRYTDLFVPCREGLYTLCGSEDTDACNQFLRTHFNGTLLVTLGNMGSVAYDAQGNRYERPARRITPVDTTGAGDSYMGAMLYAYLLNGMPLADAMEFATVCSSVTCCSLGARSGPGLTQVKEILAREG